MIKLPKIPKSFKNKRILMRVDFNVPCRMGKVVDDFRIKKTIPAIKQLLRKNSVILIAHFEDDGKIPSLLHIASYLKRNGLPRLRFVDDIVGEKAKKAAEKIKPGDVILLENLRKDKREKKNTASFAKELASLADVYLNEAFSACHREHASIVGVPKYLPSYAGPLLAAEVKHLKKSFRPKKPFIFILGGNKFSTKAFLVSSFLRKANYIFVGGGIANTFLSAKGYKVGNSPVEKDVVRTIKKRFLRPKIITPIDVVVKREGSKKTITLEEIEGRDIIYDSGPDTIKILEPLIRNAKFILWNGPVGLVEEGFDSATRQLAKILVDAKAEVIVGGGDTVAYLDKIGLTDKFYFVSTGGGAMLDFLAHKTLPGIEALSKK